MQLLISLHKVPSIRTITRLQFLNLSFPFWPRLDVDKHKWIAVAHLTSTAHVPQDPMPRQLMYTAPSLWGVRPDCSRAVRSFAPLGTETWRPR